MSGYSAECCKDSVNIAPVKRGDLLNVPNIKVSKDEFQLSQIITE